MRVSKSTLSKRKKNENKIKLNCAFEQTLKSKWLFDLNNSKWMPLQLTRDQLHYTFRMLAYRFGRYVVSKSDLTMQKWNDWCRFDVPISDNFFIIFCFLLLLMMFFSCSSRPSNSSASGLHAIAPTVAALGWAPLTVLEFCCWSSYWIWLTIWSST